MRLSLESTFFFQAEDGIRDADVTGVQTCALPIYFGDVLQPNRHIIDAIPIAADAYVIDAGHLHGVIDMGQRIFERRAAVQIGRASCRERRYSSGGRWRMKTKMTEIPSERCVGSRE